MHTHKKQAESSTPNEQNKHEMQRHSAIWEAHKQHHSVKVPMRSVVLHKNAPGIEVMCMTQMQAATLHVLTTTLMQLLNLSVWSWSAARMKKRWNHRLKTKMHRTART